LQLNPVAASSKSRINSPHSTAPPQRGHGSRSVFLVSHLSNEAQARLNRRRNWKRRWGDGWSAIRYRVSLKSGMSSEQEPEGDRWKSDAQYGNRQSCDTRNPRQNNDKWPTRLVSNQLGGQLIRGGLRRLIRILVHAPMIPDRSCKSHRGSLPRGRTRAARFWANPSIR
jgi:hypothetical protein